MFSLKGMPSTTSVLSTYTTFAASAMLVRTVIKEVQTLTSQIIPKQLQTMMLSKLGGLFTNHSSQMTIIIDGYNGFSTNQLYEASQLYLSTKITASLEKLKVSKTTKEKNLSVTINKGEKISDVFEGICLVWEMSCKETEERSSQRRKAERVIELSFPRKYMERILNIYLPYVMEKSNAIKEQNKVVKLYALGHFGGDSDRGGAWSSMNLDHPATFDTIAMDPSLKQALIGDLDRFVKRRKFYRRVGKVWKRGYLLYGPPGTGKSSLIAAMANYLKFNIYDMELTSVSCNSALRRQLVSTSNRSILVIEDIDCSVKLQDRQNRKCAEQNEYGELTLSGLLNFIDGLWSSCGDERIIVFTTNHKNRLDPALLRPGRMDMHIHMSYCNPSGFRILVSNYLGINDHNLFPEIDELLTKVEVTPAEIAEELMKSEVAEVALEGLVEFLKRKKTEVTEVGNKQEASREAEADEKIGEFVRKAKKRRSNTKRNRKGL